MLGHHPKLRHDLQQKGKRALAKVRQAKRMHWAETTGSSPAGQVANQKVLWKLVLLVEPEGGEAFEARVEEMLPWSLSVEPSERHYQFVVLYDPSDHEKVVIDWSDEGARMLEVTEFKERADAQVSRMRERGQGAMADRLQAAQASMAEYMGADRSKLTADQREDALHAQQQKMREIMAGDSMRRAEQIRAIQLDAGIAPQDKQAKIMELMAGMGVGAPSVLVGGQPMAPAAAPDPAATADALSKLADLRDRGVLTEAEFEAQKKRLLGE